MKPLTDQERAIAESVERCAQRMAELPDSFGGRPDYRSWEECPTCEGRRQVEKWQRDVSLMPIMINCPDCDGTGEIEGE
jgi:DnaJ-class molecular chaperone